MLDNALDDVVDDVNCSLKEGDLQPFDALFLSNDIHKRVALLKIIKNMIDSNNLNQIVQHFRNKGK